MKKVPTLYIRDPATNLRYVRNEVHPDCQWVINGEGQATYKYNGTAVLIDDDLEMWKRREVRAGQPDPDGFRQEGDADPNTGKRVGWVPIDPADPNDRWHVEAWNNTDIDHITGNRTYELIGPKVQGNPHQCEEHRLERHGNFPINGLPTEFDELGAWLHTFASSDPGFEGVVWHHPDGRMAKIKVKDFPTP